MKNVISGLKFVSALLASCNTLTMDIKYIDWAQEKYKITPTIDLYYKMLA